MVDEEDSTRAKLRELCRALEAGTVGPGSAMHVEDLSCVMQVTTFTSPMRNPRWYEFWKYLSKDYMYLLRFQQEETKIHLHA